MRRLWPETAGPEDVGPASLGPARELTDHELAAHYPYPDGVTRPYLRANFVASLDGAAEVDGRSRALSAPPDRRVFHLLRGLCEVILVGAGTAKAERYGRERSPSRVTGAPPRVAVVTRRAELDPDGPLFTETRVPTLVLTTPLAPAAAVRRLADTGAEVDTRGTEPAQLLAALHERGLHRVLCEGGPMLFGALAAGDAVDELCLTLAPLLVGASAPRITRDAGALTGRLELASALTEQDLLFLRYLRRR